MNNQQAINLLKDLEKNLDDYCELNDEGKTAFGMAITALELFGNSEQLPSIQPEQSACEYCHEDSDGYVLSVEKNGHAYIQNGKLVLRANGWWGECGIDYCPMCGRKLRGDKHEAD